MASVTKNPGTGNGHVQRWGKGSQPTRTEAAWDDLGAGTGTHNPGAISNPASTGLACLLDLGSLLDDNFYRYSGRLPFDCTDLAGATINSAVLRLYVSSKIADINGTVHVCPSTQASYSALTTSDWSLVTKTNLCDTHPTISSFTTGAYYEFTLNAAGLAHIASGNGRLAILHQADFTDTLVGTPPSGVTSIGDNLTINYVGAASNKPELVIDYTPLAGGRPFRRRPSGLYTR